MSMILHIDTAMESAFVCVSSNGVYVDVMYNHVQKDHAAFLHPAIEELIKRNHLSFSDLSAIAVTKGPGSYTGIRVGMAAAKGLAFALQKPLITINNLELLAKEVLLNFPEDNILICPMIDARRMEVFTALYNHHLHPIIAPSAVVLDNNYLSTFLSENKVVFTGNGAQKFINIISHQQVTLYKSNNAHQAMCNIAHERLEAGLIELLVDCEPMYLKEYQNV